jgi:TolA-binding protein
MFKKATLVYLVLFGITTFMMENECLGETTLAEAQQNICNIIDAGNLEAASSATDKMMTDFNNNPDLPEALYWVIRHCEWTSKLDEAKRLYQMMKQNYPDNIHAKQSQIGIARCETMALVMSQDYTKAKEALDKMAIDFSAHPDLPESLYMVAERFEWQWQFEKEKYVYQKIIQNHPASAFSSKAQIGIARADILSFIALQYYEQFDKSLDKLFVSFKDNPELPQTAIIIGERFYRDGLSKRRRNSANEAKDSYERAIKVWDRVIRELPDSNLIPSACCWMGDAYSELGRYKEAIEYYKKSSDDYPQFSKITGIDNVYRWRSVFMTGQSLQKLKESGDMNSAEADPSIIEAYERLVCDSASCPRAKDAWRELGYLYAQNNSWQDTTRCFEAYLRQISEERCPPEVFYELATAYDQSGDFDSAKKNYKLFIASALPDEPHRNEARIRLAELTKAN